MIFFMSFPNRSPLVQGRLISKPLIPDTMTVYATPTDLRHSDTGRFLNSTQENTLKNLTHQIGLNSFLLNKNCQVTWLIVNLFRKSPAKSTFLRFHVSPNICVWFKTLKWFCLQVVIHQSPYLTPDCTATATLHRLGKVSPTPAWWRASSRQDTAHCYQGGMIVSTSVNLIQSSCVA